MKGDLQDEKGQKSNLVTYVFRYDEMEKIKKETLRNFEINPENN